MELKAFLAELVTNLARLDFVTALELRTEVFTVKGRVHLTRRGFLEVYFNEQTQTVAVAWIESEQRRWGIDWDFIPSHRDHAQNILNIKILLFNYLTVWYDEEGDYLEVLFAQKKGYFRKTDNDAVMEKVDEAGNIIGFSILKVSALKSQAPLAVTLNKQPV
jgi:hypothetical protein